MLKDVKWAEDGTYRPGEYYSPEKFFEDSLHNSMEFDLQLGYFSSAAISVLSDGFASFIANGGRMRLVINHIVSSEDKKAIKRGMSGEVLDCVDLTNYEDLLLTFDEYDKHFFHCLAYMIQEGRIDIQIIKPKGKFGISHTKSGQFRDENSVMSFSGSANFTISGLFNNIEEIKIERSESSDPMVQKSIASQRILFDSIMNHTKSGIEYLSPDKLIAAISSHYGDKSVDELIDVERKLHKIKVEKLMRKKGLYVADDEDNEPHFPFPSGPRPYQKEAFDNWRNNDQKGLFAMATGTGKTITSLNCLLEIYQRKGYYMAMILVPTITLVNQWEQECRKFGFDRIIKVYSKNPDWKEEVSRYSFSARHNMSKNSVVSFVVISTYASYCKKKVFDILNAFDPARLLLIADECHNMGSETMLKRLKEIPYLRRIGLSATPKRQFDERGNSKIEKFFGAEEKYTFEYSMEKAIENGVLCRYLYYPHVIKLTPVEMDEYVELSLKIAKYFNYNKECFENIDEMLKRLLLKRKRIVHKAFNKYEVFKEIIDKRYEDKGNLRYTLVYVPEGNKPDYLEDTDIFDLKEEIEDDKESEHLIDKYTSAVMNVDEHMTVRKFVSGQKDRDVLLQDFASGRVQVLTSMKCLDEGVDVPRSEFAIFCSSTGNPRQFIQRRGRVLRTHKDKHMAILHDLVVVPEINPFSDSYMMERSLVKSELLRVRNFALLSENPSFSEFELRSVMEHYGLNLYNNQ